LWRLPLLQFSVGGFCVKSLIVLVPFFFFGCFGCAIFRGKRVKSLLYFLIIALNTDASETETFDSSASATWAFSGNNIPASSKPVYLLLPKASLLVVTPLLPLRLGRLIGYTAFDNSSSIQGWKMKRWMLVVAWFILLFLWNFTTKPTSEADYILINRLFIAVAFMLAPIEIIASILAVAAIYKIPWKKKPVA
jgi:hypothetical protein